MAGRQAFVHGTDPIVVEMTDEGDRIALSISNGGTIVPEMLPRLFGALSGSGGEKDGSDLGLGLYIVQQIVQAHGGIVSAQSTDGRTTMRMDLPRRAVTPEALKAP